jgi:hypothetical protein
LDQFVKMTESNSAPAIIFFQVKTGNRLNTSAIPWCRYRVLVLNKKNYRTLIKISVTVIFRKESMKELLTVLNCE